MLPWDDSGNGFDNIADVLHSDVNAPQADGATALAWAAHWDNLATADLLIRAGADPSLANDLRVTPLALACTNGSLPIVEKLLQAGANPVLGIWSRRNAWWPRDLI